MVTMALQRQLLECHEHVLQGQYQEFKWSIMRHGNTELAGKTLGILGFGRIGRQVARRAIPFELNTLYYDIVRASPEDEAKYNVTYVDYPELLRRADILTVHTPLDKSTYHIVGEEEISMLKPSALVVNASRGPVVDLAPLATALAEGRIAGAAIDVYETEPAPDTDPIVALGKTGFPRLVLTPHVAGITEEAQRRALKHALDNLARFARGERILDICNGVDA
jgi:glyoxylate reductase